jgi:integrase
MMLIKSTESFTIQGIPYVGVPILVTDEMNIVKPVLKFIIYHCVRNGNVQSKKTILSYANSLYDFFSFISTNNLSWEQPYKSKGGTNISIIALYRNWSTCLAGSSALKASTINTRLVAIQRFYEYCHKQGIITCLPWDEVKKARHHNNDLFLCHTRAIRHVNSTDLRLKTYKHPPKILTVRQAKQLISAIDNITLRLMVKLALTTGLRREELITFQREHVFKPSQKKMNNRLPIDLIPQPGKQSTKGNRARTIYVPAPLMMTLYDYTLFGEGVKRMKHAIMRQEDTSKLFLNYLGKTYSDNSLNSLLNKLYKNRHIDFMVTPHMLRHTYATIELYAESMHKDLAQALSWVRDRLGHSSIQTTMIYIHCIEQMENHELHQYQKELLMMADL